MGVDSQQPLYERPAHELREGIGAKRYSARELTQEMLDRIHAVDPELNAYITTDDEGALARAAVIDAKVANGEPLGVLAGIPVALKDLLCTRDLPTTCGSRILQGFVPPYDATAVARVRDADAVILGKLNMDEFAMGSSNENSAFGPVRNPVDPSHVPGGSSGGSAAAVAACEAAVTLGSDTGGSVRQPASFCGVVGLKPTYGRVSRYGLVAYASSLDQIGPLARNTRDTARMLGVIAGHDAQDSTSADVPVDDYEQALSGGVEGLVVGLPTEYFQEGLDPEVEAAVRAGIAALERAGATVKDVSLPVAGHAQYAIAAYYIIATAEASSNLSRYDGVRFGFRSEAADLVEMYCDTRSRGFGEEVKRRIMLGTYALSSGYYDAYYLRAQRVRTLIKRDFDAALEDCHVLASPVAPTPAFKIGEKTQDPLQMYLSDIYTVSVNLAGIPGISVPCSASSAGLPIGLQLLGRPFDERTLFQAAFAVEQEMS